MKIEDKWFTKDSFQLRKYQFELQSLNLGVESEEEGGLGSVWHLFRIVKKSKGRSTKCPKLGLKGKF